ncbi:MAG: hypothetical protein RBT72_08395 [Spirochaetia bacterium]|jgi:hypothetical protein|nr:hypothetical protein [Spirochaetia bacterium]
MPREFGTDFDPDKMDGFDNPTPGKCHLEIVRVEENATSKAGNPQMEVDFEILAHTDPDQVAKSHREYFPWTAKAESKALQFAVACGLTTVEELKALKDAGKGPVIDFNLAEGRQILGELKEEEYEGRKSTKLNFNMFRIDSPKHKDFPRNQGKINQLGDAQEDPFVSGGNTSSGPVAGAAASADTDLFG